MKCQQNPIRDGETASLKHVLYYQAVQRRWMLHLLTDLWGWEDFFIYAQQDASENRELWKVTCLMSSLLVRILRVKNRRGLSLRQMEEDVLCIPKDGG